MELDSISGRIAKQLYQKNNISVQGFETAQYPDSFFDCVIGNVPFGNYQVSDRKYDKYSLMIHDYFIVKSLDLIRPGGVVAVITSSRTMDKESEKVRLQFAEKADLLGAIRLPENAFRKNAGTDVVSDVYKRQGVLLAIGLLAAGGAGAYYYFKVAKPKKAEIDAEDEDLEFYNGPYINEDEDIEDAEETEE